MRHPGFPSGTPPFDRFEPEAVAFLDAHLALRRFPQGAVLVSPDFGEATQLFIVGAGQVQGRVAQPAPGEPAEALRLSVGECFPVGALSGRRASANIYEAATEVEAYLLPAPRFHELLALSPAFARFCSGYLARLVSESRRQAQAHVAEQASPQQSLHTALRELVQRAPVFVGAQASIQEAVETMGAQKTGSVIVVNSDQVPVGLITQSDVVRRVVLGRVPLERPVAEVMTADPVTVPERATAADAMFVMASRSLRHLLLVDGAGRLTGVVSEHDLFALQRHGLARLRRAIDAAPDVPALARALGEVRASAFTMLEQGVGGEPVTQYLSAMNDAATRRALTLRQQAHRLDDVAWAWLAFGSEGREEQTLATDQDNGLIFLAAEKDREGVRARLLAFAHDVNADLEQLGFPRCAGGIMAGNPEWCLTLDEWKAKFTAWVAWAHPAALLNATIFFDFRALYGRGDLADRLHEHLPTVCRGNDAFLRLMAAQALSVAPPLGLLRDFVTEPDAQGRSCLDLKKHGARLFVDAARVLALAQGESAASTVQRLRRTARLPGGVGEPVEAMVDAFNFLQLLRLRHQHEAPGPTPNLVPLSGLNALDRRILKEAFRQAKALQQRLQLTYQV